jgi:hypothetical protein
LASAVLGRHEPKRAGRQDAEQQEVQPSHGRFRRVFPRLAARRFSREDWPRLPLTPA